jgi:hypothetical protein
MRKGTIAAAAAAIVLSGGGAYAHEFACEKTVEGQVIHVVEQYPTTLHFKVVVTNTHPTDASTALAVQDDVLSALGVRFKAQVPFTLAVGGSAEFNASVTVHNQRECMQLSQAQACKNTFEDAFQVVFDGGVAQCAARLVCMPDKLGSGGKE